MAWTFYSNDAEDSTDVVTAITNTLNSRSNNETATAKIGISDQRHGHSYGVLFYNKDAGSPPAYNLTGPWNHKNFTWDHNDQYESNYGSIASFLNGETEENLTPTQAAYAHFSMCDYESGTAVGAVYWQNE